jgi:curved DNA-binding protein CbpA
MREITPIHGVDYLQDHYTVLEIERNATPDQIRTAYHTLSQQYHPDKTHNLGAELQRAAERKFKILTLAYRTLSDPTARASYDQRLATFDPKLISRTGNPVIDLSKRRVDLDFLLSGSGVEGRTELEAQAIAVSGFDAAMLRILKRAYESKQDPETRAAYKEMLLRKQAYLSIVEELSWQAAGVANQNDTKMLTSPQDHLAQRREQITDYEAELGTVAEKRMLAIATGDTSLLLPGPGQSYKSEQITENPMAVASKVAGLAIEQFRTHVPELEELAQQRTRVLEELCGLVEWRYLPENQPPKDRIKLLYVVDRVVRGSAEFERSGNAIKNTEDPADTGLNGKTVQELEDLAIGGGLDQTLSDRSIALVELTNEYDLMLQISAVLNQHFERQRV